MPLRIPATSLTKHLMWTRSGIVWATWRLQGLSYGFGSAASKKLVRAHHQALFQNLRGEGMLLGLCANLDPVTIAERMLANVPIEDSPEWADEVTLTLDSLEEIPIGTRAFWLSVPLAAGSIKHRFRAALRSANTQLRDTLSLPRQLPTAGEVASAMKAAEKIEQGIPSVFKPARATAAEQVWIALHSQHRGLGLDQVTPLPGSAATPDPYSSTEPIAQHFMPSEFPSPFVDEGGQSDLTKNSLQQLNPFSRRYLKVQSPFSEEPSYQVMQALIGTPKAGWQVPGVEWISRIEQFNVSADWVVRFQVSSADDVRRRNKTAEIALEEQMSQQDAPTGNITGGTSALDDVAEALSAYVQSLNASDKEVEVQATTMIAVGAATPQEAKAQARFIAEDYKRSDFLFEAPLGKQEDLWWAMQPGNPTPRIVREMTQITTGREFATSVPLATTELGDEHGIYFADNITSGRGTPVLLDIQGNIQADSSGSVGIVAELGAGKSVALKKIAGDTIDRGGRIVAIDRTESKEYATFASSLVPEDTCVVDLLVPKYSLDPIRVFGVKTGSRHVQSLFSTMLGIKARDPLGVALSRLLAPEYVETHGIASLGKLRSHLASINRNSEQDEILGLINLIAEKDFGGVLFDDSLPPLDLGAQAIVALTHGLALPDETELTNKHLFDEMPLEKIFGRAMYMLLTAIAREVCFMDPGQLALFIVDETHHITASPEGERELLIFFRDGRKHGAAAVVASHDPYDFGDERTRGLIKIRIVMRQTDKVLAQRALAWLADLGDDAAMLKEVMENTSPIGPDGTIALERRGEGIMRDVRGRKGKIRVALSQRPHRRLALLSTPSRSANSASEAA